jgi:hypothetical protein
LLAFIRCAEILTKDQITTVIEGLVGHPLYEIAVLDLATGLRPRGAVGP